MTDKPPRKVCKNPDVLSGSVGQRGGNDSLINQQQFIPCVRPSLTLALPGTSTGGARDRGCGEVPGLCRGCRKTIRAGMEDQEKVSEQVLEKVPEM